MMIKSILEILDTAAKAKSQSEKLKHFERAVEILKATGNTFQDLPRVMKFAEIRPAQSNPAPLFLYLFNEEMEEEELKTITKIAQKWELTHTLSLSEADTLKNLYNEYKDRADPFFTSIEICGESDYSWILEYKKNCDLKQIEEVQKFNLSNSTS